MVEDVSAIQLLATQFSTALSLMPVNTGDFSTQGLPSAEGTWKVCMVWTVIEQLTHLIERTAGDQLLAFNAYSLLHYTTVVSGSNHDYCSCTCQQRGQAHPRLQLCACSTCASTASAFPDLPCMHATGTDSVEKCSNPLNLPIKAAQPFRCTQIKQRHAVGGC